MPDTIVTPGSLGTSCCGWRWPGGIAAPNIMHTNGVASALSDSSGHALHWTASGPLAPYVQRQVRIPLGGKVTGAWGTEHWALASRLAPGVGDYVEHAGNVYSGATIRMGGPFWLQALVGNTRESGESTLWGASEGHRVVLDHGRNLLHLTIEGDRKLIARQVPAGVFLLEVGRGSRHKIEVRVNGAVIANGMRHAGSLLLGGWGWAGQSGEYAFRDWLFEEAEFVRRPTAATHRSLLRYYAARYGLSVD